MKARIDNRLTVPSQRRHEYHINDLVICGDLYLTATHKTNSLSMNIVLKVIRHDSIENFLLTYIFFFPFSRYVGSAHFFAYKGKKDIC